MLFPMIGSTTIFVTFMCVWAATALLRRIIWALATRQSDKYQTPFYKRWYKKVSTYDKEIPQPQTADQSV